MRYLYSTSIYLYYAGIRTASVWNEKARKWMQGRQNWAKKLEAARLQDVPLIWVHCSSAGEFEQGKPLIEGLKAAYPGHKVLLTFFSPSGYEVAQNYPFADAVAYLPLDTKKNAEQFFSIVQPQLAVFVKYEFWYHFLSAAAFRHIPLILVSAVFRPGQVFFRRWASFYQGMLFLFRHIFVQDAASQALLQQWNIDHVSTSGDTRFDRVVSISQNFTPIPTIEAFAGDEPLVVAGSTWAGDEAVIARVPDLPYKWIIAPHEVDDGHISTLEAAFPGALRYSACVKDFSKDKMEAIKKARVLIIDNVGMLSRLYQYATVTFVGGGFTRDGIHNILEAAVWHKPVLFGPNYQKYREAKELIAAGGAWSIGDSHALRERLESLRDPELLQQAGLKAHSYVEENKGAASKILHYIQEKRLLTR